MNKLRSIGISLQTKQHSEDMLHDTSFPFSIPVYNYIDLYNILALWAYLLFFEALSEA